MECVINVFSNYCSGSKYFENERRKEEKMQQKIHEQENRRKRITTADLEIGAIEVLTLA